MRTFVRTAAWSSALVLLVACASSPPRRPALPSDVDPNDPLAGTKLMQQGQTLVAEGKFTEGMARFTEAQKLQPRNPTVYNVIGMAQLQQGKAADALQSFNQALALAPNYSDARNNRGAAYVQLKQYAMAEADYLAVLADDTYANRAGVCFNLGSLYLALGNLGGAEENLRRATRGNGPVEAYVLLGQVEEKLGKTELAEGAFRDAVSHAPERPDVVLELANFLNAHGRHDEARPLYHRVLELASPGSPAAQQARARLE
jgi:tetratricopeptide (TPR) repeat protein